MTDSIRYLTPRADGKDDAWAEEAAARGQRGTQQLREVSEVAPPAHIAEALRLSAGETCIVRRRLVLADARPVELADSYYPLSIARASPLAEARKVKGGAVAALAALGHAPVRAKEDVSARRPTAEEARLLDLTESDWVLVLCRTSRDADGVEVEASVMIMVAEGRHLRYELTV